MEHFSFKKSEASEFPVKKIIGMVSPDSDLKERQSYAPEVCFSSPDKI
jgi:hypothetical protein